MLDRIRSVVTTTSLGFLAFLTAAAVSPDMLEPVFGFAALIAFLFTIVGVLVYWVGLVIEHFSSPETSNSES